MVGRVDDALFPVARADEEEGAGGGLLEDGKVFAAHVGGHDLHGIVPQGLARRPLDDAGHLVVVYHGAVAALVLE